MFCNYQHACVRTSEIDSYIVYKQNTVVLGRSDPVVYDTLEDLVGRGEVQGDSPATLPQPDPRHEQGVQGPYLQVRQT